MPTQDSLAAAQFWRQRAALLAARLNFHYWLARLIPLLAGLLVLVALFEIFRRETSLPLRWSEALLLFGTGVACAIAWLTARRNFCSEHAALVRLETVLGLHNQLSAADAGVLPWPKVPARLDDGYRANWRQIALPLLAGLAFLWSAHLVPVSQVRLGASSEPIAEPPEFAQVQSWINTLKAEDLIEPAKLEDLQSALDKLKDRPAQDWYTQGNLEAASSLKELTEQSMNALAQDLAQADQTVQAMQEKTENSSDEAGLKPMQDELRKAGENLASGNLPLKRELTSQLRGGEDAGDKPMSAQQLQALHERLQKGELAARTAAKTNAGLSQEMQQAMASAAMGQGVSRREGVPGPGGAGGGTESAPLELQARKKDTPEGALTAVHNDDMSRASLGETLKVTASEHAVDRAAYHGPQNAGTAQVTGSGGEAVWRSTYDPQEADTLSRFFK